MKFTTFMILLVLGSCVVDVECKFRIRAKPRIRSRSTQINRQKILEKLQTSCMEELYNSTGLNAYYCRRCVDNINYCHYSNLPIITQEYCSELATNMSYTKIPYYCSVCLANLYHCESPKSFDFKRFDTIRVYKNCSNYPMDADKCVKFCRIDKLLPKGDYLGCQRSSTTIEMLYMSTYVVMAYLVWKFVSFIS